MKRFTIVIGAIALAACLATGAYAKGHAAGHAHHSGAHHAAHHSSHHAHSGHHSVHHATPHISHATKLSTSRHGYHNGYGHRRYHRNAHYRRHAAQRGRSAFLVGPDQIVPVNCGPRVVAPWATILASGGGGQAPRAAHFQVTNNSNPGLFAQAPAVSSVGTLSFTPAAGQSGIATLTLVLRSTAGSSAPQAFHITVKP